MIKLPFHLQIAVSIPAMKIYLIFVLAINILLLLKEVDSSSRSNMFLNMRNLTQHNQNQTSPHNSDLNIYEYLGEQDFNRTKRQFLPFSYNLPPVSYMLEVGFRKCGLHKFNVIKKDPSQKKTMIDCIIKYRKNMNKLDKKIFFKFLRNIMSQLNSKNQKGKHIKKPPNDKIKPQLLNISSEIQRKVYTKDNVTKFPTINLSDDGSGKEQEGIILYMNFTTNDNSPFSIVESPAELKNILKTLPETVNYVMNEIRKSKQIQ